MNKLGRRRKQNEWQVSNNKIEESGNARQACTMSHLNSHIRKLNLHLRKLNLHLRKLNVYIGGFIFPDDSDACHKEILLFLLSPADVSPSLYKCFTQQPSHLSRNLTIY